MGATEGSPDLKSESRSLKKVVIALVTGAILVGVGAWFRPSDTNLDEIPFFARKLADQRRYDLVIVGDSRAVKGLDPDLLARGLGCTATNFGFSGVGLNDDYLKQVTNRLAARRETRILIALTPYSLTVDATRRSDFVTVTAMHWYERATLALSPSLVVRFRPYTPMDFQSLASRASVSRITQTFHESGWIETQAPSGGALEAGRLYERLFHNNSVNPELTMNLLRQIRAWRSAGVRVYVFRMPADTIVQSVEDRLSEFDWPDLQTDLIAAGATVLPVGESRYQTYDGDHLPGPETHRLTLDVLHAIQGADAAR